MPQVGISTFYFCKGSIIVIATQLQNQNGLLSITKSRVHKQSKACALEILCLHTCSLLTAYQIPTKIDKQTN